MSARGVAHHEGNGVFYGKQINTKNAPTGSVAGKALRGHIHAKT